MAGGCRDSFEFCFLCTTNAEFEMFQTGNKKPFFKGTKMLINLYEETEEAIKEAHKNWADVDFICAKESDWRDDNNKLYRIDVFEFMKFAKNFNYDNGFGGAEVNITLKIIFSDKTFLERHEYDGAEEWVYKKIETPDDFCPYDIKLLISNKFEDREERDKYTFGGAE